MGMGGGSAGGAVPPGGLTPLQAEQANQGKTLVNRFFNEGAPLAQDMSKLAQGGLQVQGMKAVQAGLNAPSVTPGMMARTAQRFGVTADPAQAAAMQRGAALQAAAGGVRTLNAARESLTGVQQDMRLGGMGG